MTLEALNGLGAHDLRVALERCNGARAWVEGMVQAFPVASVGALLTAAERIWYEGCGPGDWLEAFGHHPRIGDMDALREKFASTREWAASEQAGVGFSPEDVLIRLAAGNKAYEERFGYIFIVCATGKTAVEMLALLEARLSNDPETELRIAMGEQNKITLLRLEKLLS